jgi:type I restriction enzyme M protein
MTTETDYLKQAVAEGRLQITTKGKTERVVYVASGHCEKWGDPEEKVRAAFYAELIYQYGYKPGRIGVEVTVPRRVPSDRADLVVYKDDEHKHPFIVIENKRDGVSDSEFNQAIEQACGNRASLGATYAGIVAGGTRRFLNFTATAPGERKRNIIADLPIDYGRPPAYRYYKGEPGKDLAAVSREELRAAIRKCHQTLWEGGKRSPIVAFGEFCKIVFVKIRDETDRARPKGKPYAFQRGTDDTDEDLARRIQELYDDEKKREPDVFTDKLNVDAGILARVVEHLESISLSRTDLDTKGVAFEEFMGGFFKGDFGQFFTPRELIAFCVQMLDPGPDQTILDPACGSGGFLLYALDHIRTKADAAYPNHGKDPHEAREHFRYWHDFAEKNLFGLEINDELARVAKMNMIIHDDGHTNIIGHDALDFMREITGKNKQLKHAVFDMVLTNPPFGSVVKEAEKGGGYLGQYKLRGYLGKNATEPNEEAASETDAKRGAKAVKARASIKTEILFLERVWHFLKPEGKVAIILPDGILTNSSLQGVRLWLLEKFQLLAVVSLPQFAFSHYDAGVKASIVFLRKLAEAETVADDMPIFMALAENIGYDATGRKTFAVTVESETPEDEKIERHSSDLFDYRVYYEWSTANPKKPGWSERHREVIPGTGLVAEWRAFGRNPEPFFV